MNVIVTNIQNPSSPGSYTWGIFAYGIGSNLINVGVKPGKTVTSSIVSSLGFRSLPYGRVVLSSGNAVAASGLKVVNIANTWFTYILYHPFDAGDSIRRIILTVPPAFATVAGTSLMITNLTTGAQLTNFTVGAIGAGLPKTFYLSIPPVPPGNVLLITLSVLTTPTTAGPYVWECYVEGVSGQIVRVLDMPGFVAPQQFTAIAAPPAGWYGDVYPFFDVTTRTLGWPTSGSSNNVYRMVFWNTAAWAAGNNPRISFPTEFGVPTGAGVSSIQNNGAGYGTTILSNIGGVWMVSNTITGAGAANNNIFVSVTNIVNPSSPGSYTFGMAAGGSPVSTTSGYDRVVTIVPHLFTNVPTFGISVVGGTTNTNDVSVNLLLVHNPTNSGDAIDRIEITVPSGYTFASVVTDFITVLNSSGRVASASVVVQPTPTSSGRIVVDMSPIFPLGEGGSVYIPVVVSNPSSAGVRIWSCAVSGLRDVTNIASGIMVGMTNRVGIVAVPLPSDGTNYVPGNAVSTNKSPDDIAWMIVTNGTFNETSLVTIGRVSVVPGASSSQSNEYIFIGGTYEFTSSLALLKPVRVRLYYSNANTNFISVTNRVESFRLARYNENRMEWEVVVDSVIGDGYVEAEVYTLGKYRIWEYRGSYVGSEAKTNKSPDDIAWMIVTNDTFVAINEVRIFRPTWVPGTSVAQSNEYVFIGNVYEFTSTLLPRKPVWIRLYYSNANTNFVTSTNVIANFKLARYDEAMGEWIVLASSVVGDGYVEVYTFNLGKYRIWEYKGVTGGTVATNVFLVGKASGGVYTYDNNKLKVEIPNNSLQVDGYLTIDVFSKTNALYKKLPNYLVDVIGKQYNITITSSITRPVTVSIYYTDEEVKGRVIERLALAYFDETEERWIVVPSVVDKENKRVYAKTYHFSVWTLVENRTPTSDLVSSVYIYPNPSKDNVRISFALNQTSRIVIEAYDFTGRKVATLRENEVRDVGLFEMEWDLTSSAGVKLPNGVYLIRIYVQSADLRKSFNNVYKVYVAK